VVPPDLTLEDLAAALEPELSGPEYETFQAVQEAFPKDLMGNVDWVAGLKAGLFQPRPGIDPEAAEMPALPLDVLLDPGIPGLEVVFPHAPHTERLRCDSCHPAIFQMKAGADPITMAGIFAGEYCGRCHGKVAFAPATGCPRCHVRMAGGG
jgi:c(7)-type cytochrome triheme protein